MTSDRATEPAPRPDLVLKAYDTALDDADWQELISEIAQAAGARMAMLMLQDLEAGSGALLATHNVDSLYTEQYWQTYARINPWARAMSSIVPRSGSLVRSHLTLPSSELVTTPFYCEFLAPQDLFYSCACVLESSRERVGLLALNTGRRQGPIEGRRLRELSALTPHLERAMRVRRLLVDERARFRGLRDVADEIARGVLLVDRRRRAVDGNLAAFNLLESGDGLRLDCRNRVYAVDERANEMLQAALRIAAVRAFGSPGPLLDAIAVPRLSSRLPCSVNVLPAGRGDDPLATRVPRAALLINLPERPHRLNASTLRAIFGMTRSESLVAVLLAEGAQVGEIADKMDVTVNTVRSHIKRLLVKSGTSRQVELVALLSRLAIPFVSE
jgi:DNA-binding CsgD family transcriptional regulator